ncbi:MAG: PP2C family protein-serine/threonine phosphatase [bacterium]
MGDDFIPRPLLLLVNLVSDLEVDWNAFLSEDLFEIVTARSFDDARQVLTSLQPDLIVVSARGLSLGEQEQLRALHALVARRDLDIPLLFFHADENSTVDEAHPNSLDHFHLSPVFTDPELRGVIGPVHRDRMRGLCYEHMRLLLRRRLQYNTLQRTARDLANHQEHVQRLLDRDLYEAAVIQRSFLPRSFPSHPEITLAAVYEPSIQIGGDYYDVIPLDEGRWAVVIADIAGHGTAAAVVMALTQIVVKEFGKGIKNPGEALRVFNGKLNANLTSDHYVTMFYALLDLTALELTYASAGHVPFLYYSARERQAYVMKPEPSYPLRTFPVESYPEYRLALQSGDRVLLYTDGVTDVQNPQHQFYGMERLLDTFAKHQALPPDHLVKQILEDTERFRATRDRLDDFTLLALARKAG